MADKVDKMRVQVCYAKPGQQFLLDLDVAEGATVEEAIRLSGIERELGGIDLAACEVGIYGKLKTMDTRVRQNDRIEIYRPLLADPKEARRKRALKKGK